MNRIYRIVFNRASGVFQVVSETASSTGAAGTATVTSAFGPRLSRLAAACMLALGALGVAPAMAAGGNGGDYIYEASSGGAGGTAATPDGGQGASFFDNGAGGGGGSVHLSGALAGNGGSGGAGGGDFGGVLFGGAGGAGGNAGLVFENSRPLPWLIGTGGANGASATEISDPDNTASGGGGGGGGGGFGGVATGSVVSLIGIINGGNGGKGGNGDPTAGVGSIGGGGGGGEGGGGLLATSGGAFVTNSGVILGGSGGNGGNGGNGTEAGAVNTRGGNGGDGGNGFVSTVGGVTLINNALIFGGAGGEGGTASAAEYNGLAGKGGSAVVGSDLTVINNGSLIGGAGAAGAPAPTAVVFTGGTNTLQLGSTSTIAGNVLAFSTADTLALGGNVAASFDVSNIGPSAQYQGFGQFAKAGTGTWSLTGTTTALTPWTVSEGALAISEDGALGDLQGTLALANGGTLRANASFDSGRELSLTGDTSIDTQGFAVTLSGKIGNPVLGELHKKGTGTLTLSNAGNNYDDATYIEAGTLALSGAGKVGNSAVAVSSGATFDISQVTSSASVNYLGGAGEVRLGEKTLVVYNGGSDSTFDGVIADGGIAGGIGGKLQVSDAGSSLTLTQAQTYTGGTTIDGGNMLLTGDGALASGSALTLNGTSKLDVAGVTAAGLTLGDLSGAGNLALGDKALTVGTAANATFAGIVSGTGSLTKVGSGALTLDGVNSYTGGTSVQVGKLVVGGAAGSAAEVAGNVNVATGATLAGHGTIGGNVDIADGAHLAPGNSIGTLNIGGDLTLAQGSLLDFEFGAHGPSFSTAGQGDNVQVAGNLTLAGATLNITDAGMGAGVYNLFGYGGTLAQSNGGLTLGTTPAGTYTLQYLSGSKKINLINATDLTLQFWNADGQASSTQAGGGSGNWSTTSPNWADATGAATGAMQPQPGFAVFGGQAGFVNVDNTDGAVSVVGMQFASDGYYVGGDTLTLVADGSHPAPVEVRVGDGSLASAGWTATIVSNIAGTDGLAKTGAGTLVLAGGNTYSGGTTVSAGTLSVDNDHTLGDAAGNVTLNGGTLQVTGTTYTGTARDIILGSSGGTFDIASPINNFTVSQAVTGAGALTKAGKGTLVLTSANTYAGGTNVNDGALQTGVTGALGNGPVAVNAGGVLVLNGNFNAGNLSLTTAPRPSPAGVVNSGTVLLADNASAGNATITNQGSLEFAGNTTAASATIDNRNGGATGFVGNATADTANITNGVRGQTNFLDNSTAGTATLTNETGGLVDFFDTSTAATATIVNQTGGNVRISNATAPGTAIGALSGGGNVILGARALTVGGLNTDATISGLVSGTGGSLVKTGTGNLTLSGANTYTGGTTVNGGTLTGNAASFGSGAIANNAALVLDQAIDATMANTLTGAGSLTKSGAGQLLYTGNGTGFTGSTQVTAGSMSVNGTLGGTTTIGSGAVLKGTGTIGTTVLASGATLAPGNSIGTLTVNGNFTFAPGSRYEVEANAAGQSDLLRVNGTATLGGAAVAVIAATGNYSLTTDYTILSATNRVGTFGGVSSNFAFLDPTLRYAGNDVLLTLRRNDVTFASQGVTPNQQATAAALQSVGASALYDVVVQSTAATAQSAFNQLSGELHASAQTALLEDSRFVRDASLDRVRQTQGGASSSAGMNVIDNGNGSASWARIFGSDGHIDGDGNASRLNRDVAGFMVGADSRLSNGWSAGGLIGYSKSDMDIDGLASTAKADSYHVGVYGGTQWDATSLRVGASYTWNKLETQRNVGFTGFANTLKADYDVSTAQVFGEIGRRIDMGTVAVEPFAGLAYVNVDADGFTESGGAAALRSGGGSTDATFSTLGVRASTQVGEATRLRGTVGWRHAFGDRTPTSTNSFATGSAFRVSGVPLAKDVAVLEAGIETELQRNMTLGVSYAGQLGDGLKDHGFKVSLGWKF